MNAASQALERNTEAAYADLNCAGQATVTIGQKGLTFSASCRCYRVANSGRLIALLYSPKIETQ